MSVRRCQSKASRIVDGQVFPPDATAYSLSLSPEGARGTVAALKPLGFAILNLGSNQPLVLAEAIRLIEKLTGRCAKIERRPAHAADVTASWADNQQAQLLLDWTPQVQYPDGLAQLVEWYCENRTWAKDVITA